MSDSKPIPDDKPNPTHRPKQESPKPKSFFSSLWKSKEKKTAEKGESDKSELKSSSSGELSSSHMKEEAQTLPQFSRKKSLEAVQIIEQQSPPKSVDEEESHEEKHPSHHVSHVKREESDHEEPVIETRRLRFECTKVEDLPKELKKMVRATKVPDEVYDQNIQVLLNILHFITKKVYHSTPPLGIHTSTSENIPRSSTIDASVSHYKANDDKNDEPKLEKAKSAKELSETIEPHEKEKKVEDTLPPMSDPGVLLTTYRKGSISLAIDDSSRLFSKQNPKDLYKNLKRSGKGGFGTVFAAKSIADNKKVAIKKVKHSTVKEKVANYSEIRYLKMVDSPNIVKLGPCYEVKDECWMVMEYMEGGTLTEARRGHDFAEAEIAYVARELLRALKHIHDRNLVHRDVKSENIMMSIMGDIKLIDFGLCIEESLIRPCMVGSPYWMPPEMINRRRHSFPTDIWSFGISILELANKNPPNSLPKIRAMFYTATHGHPNPFEEPEKWSANFHDFIGRCLRRSPNNRSTAAELLEHPFLEQAANTRKVMRKILSEIFLQRAIGFM